MKKYKMTIKPLLDGYRVNVSEYDGVLLDYRLLAFYDYPTERLAQTEGQAIVDLMNARVEIT